MNATDTTTDAPSTTAPTPGPRCSCGRPVGYGLHRWCHRCAAHAVTANALFARDLDDLAMRLARDEGRAIRRAEGRGRP